MSGERTLYTVASINPEIFKKTRKEVVRNAEGYVTGTEDVVTEYQVGTAMDGSMYEGKYFEFNFKLPKPRSMDVGDKFSGFTVETHPTWVVDVVPETGRSAAVPFIPAPAPLPNANPESYIPQAVPGEIPSWAFGSPIDGTEAGIAVAYLLGFCKYLKARIADLEGKLAEKETARVGR